MSASRDNPRAGSAGASDGGAAGPRTGEDADRTAQGKDDAPKFHSRREVVRRGVRIAFVVPVLSTFFAEDAVAAGSNHSCYPLGQACDPAFLEDCCPGLTCIGGPPGKCL